MFCKANTRDVTAKQMDGSLPVPDQLQAVGTNIQLAVLNIGLP